MKGNASAQNAAAARLKGPASGADRSDSVNWMGCLVSHVNLRVNQADSTGRRWGDQTECIPVNRPTMFLIFGAHKMTFDFYLVDSVGYCHNILGIYIFILQAIQM